MTIVSSEDTRNTEWKNNNKGAALLQKMGWTKGQGLGRRKQGSATALRAVKRTDETAGIGVSTAEVVDGSKEWAETNDSFHGVLKNLHRHYSSLGSDAGSSDSSSSSSDSDRKQKKRKKNKKRGLVLAKNKVTAGHAQKMRDAKDLSNKSEHDMRAIFGGAHSASMPVFEAIGGGSKRSKADKDKKRKKKRCRDEKSSSSSESSSDSNDSSEKSPKKQKADREAEAPEERKKRRKKDKKRPSAS